MFATLNAGHQLVFRGFTDNPDWQAGDLDIDSVTHTLDCSGKVPVGTIAILFTVNLKSSAAGKEMAIYPPADTSQRLGLHIRTQVINKFNSGYGLVFCNSAREVRYIVDLNVTTLQLSVAGWVI